MKKLIDDSMFLTCEYMSHKIIINIILNGSINEEISLE